MKIEESADCGEMRRQFDLFELDFVSDEIQPSNFETHFHECASCRNWLANWELIKVGAHKISDVSVPESVFSNIMASIEPAPQASFLTGDLVLSSLGFAILLFSLTVLASASLEESISWCLSFILLIAFHQLTKVKSARHLLGAT